MKPLSIFTYYLNNKRKVIPVVAIIALSVLGITATAAFTGVINKSVASEVTVYDHYFASELKYGKSDPFGASAQLLQAQVQEKGLVEKMFPVDVRGTQVASVIGYDLARMYFMKPQDQQAFADELQWKLVSGRMPTQEHEVALTTTMLKGKNLRIGGYIGTDVNPDDLIAGKYLIVGEFSTPEPLPSGIGWLPEILAPDDPTNAYLDTFFKPTKGRAEELDTYLRSAVDRFPLLDIRTHSTQQEELNKQYMSLDLILWSVNAVTILVISISVALINIIFFMERANEFGLLAAIGYSRARLVMKTLAESVGMVVIGWVSGVLATQGIYAILNRTIFKAAAFGLTVFDARVLIFSLPVPIAVIIFSCATVMWKLLRFDPIEIIEKRD